MRVFLILLFFLPSFISANDKTEAEVNEFIKKLDGNFRERKEASKQLKNLPPEFYPYLQKHLEKEDVSMEVKLRLTKETMFPLRSKWLHINRMNWYRKNLHEAYDKFGHKNPKWDKDVKKVLDLVHAQFSEYWIIEDYAEPIAAACQRAVRKGCKDPLILYFQARGSRKKLIDYRKLQLKKLHLNAAKALQKSKYHDYFKFRATRLAAYYTRFTHNQHYHPKPEDKKRCIDMSEKALPYFKEALKDKDLPFVELFYNAEQYCNVYYDGGKSRMDGFNKIKPILQEAYGKYSMEFLAIEGSVGINYASEIRKRDYDEGKRATKHFNGLMEEAWKKDPARKDIAVRMLTSLRDSGAKDEFEKWYNNILIADPDNYDAYKNKIIFLKNTGSTDSLWEYGHEIANRGGLMVRNLPRLMWTISAKMATGDSSKLFDFDILYKNEKFRSLIDKGFNKLREEHPENKSIILEHANALAAMYFWKDAQKLFEHGGDLNAYKGYLPLVKLRQRKIEASMYTVRGIKELTPHFINYEQRLADNYKFNQETNKYDFWKDYQAQNQPNDEWDEKIKEMLKIKERRYNGDPLLAFDDITSFHKPYELTGKLREQGNNDPLIYLFWADVKDNWFRDNTPHYFLAAKELAHSQYPNKVKLYAACMGISRLSYHKNISEEMKKDVLQLCQRLPAFIEKENTVWTEQYFKLFSALKRLKLLSPEIAQPLIDTYRKLGKKQYAFMVECHFNNQMAWYTHSLSKKKDWKKINGYNRKAQIALDKAWELNPHDSNVAENIFIKTDRFQKDFGIKLQRALYTVHNNKKILKDFMNQSGSAHSSTLRWANYPHPHAGFNLLHYDHTEMDAKHDDNARPKHWDDVSKLFEKHLSFYPNDTVARSRYAMFAIHCKKTAVAKEQLKTLGNYAIPWAFGDMKKLKEYQAKYLKE